MYGRLKGDNMNKREIIDSSLFGVELNSREIDLKPTRAFDCFLIVNRTTDDEYIIKQLIRLILLGCSSFHFFGQESFHWYKCSIKAHHMLNTKKDNKKPLLIVDWDSETDFIREICELVRCRSLISNDIYLIYDDIVQYKNIVLTYHRMTRLKGDLFIYVGNYKEIDNDNESPSVIDNISDEEIAEKKKVLSYMKSVRPDAYAPAALMDCITGEKMDIALYCCHDGIYHWRSDTIYCFEKYNLRLPDDFISFAVERKKARKHERVL